MSVQDKLERILREMHIMISRGEAANGNPDYIVVNKKEMQNHLTALSQVVSEMMDQYEATEQSRNLAEIEAGKQRTEIVRNASHQAEDIYAASVIYTDDALGRIQDIIEEASKSAREVLAQMNHQMEEEKRIVRSNQMELKSQLEDMKDSAKYFKIIEERNREAAKEKAKKNQKEEPGHYQRKTEKEPDFVPVVPEIKINEEYFEKAGLTPEGLPVEPVTEEVVYEKPEIKVNEEYIRKLQQMEEPQEQEEPEAEEEKEKHRGIFPFVWKDK